MVQLTPKEIVGLFIFLRRNEANLDPILVSMKNRLERVLFESLTLEEFDTLEELYASDVDVLSRE
jgi:hypothetical protein